MSEQPWKILPSDREILRALAQQTGELSQSQRCADLRRRWISHNALRGGGPMILAETFGLVQSGELSFESQLRCSEKWARGIEKSLRIGLYQYQEVADDCPLEPVYNINWNVKTSNFGVEVPKTHGGVDGHMGSYHWDAPITDLDRDFEKLRLRTATVDRQATLDWKSHLESIFGDILRVRIRSSCGWTCGLTWSAIDLVGLENFMLWMADNPAGIHRLMAFLRDDLLAMNRWWESQGLLSPNNENDYVGSGSLGYSDELPAADLQPGQPARRKDRWALAESQETVGVGPDMFAEFVFPYQLQVVKEFGLSYYGCCEPLHGRWHIVKQIPNLRKVSISPWCDQRIMAEALADKYVFCRKPSPTLVSTEAWDEQAIRADVRATLEVARGCPVELVLKDVHTLANQPWRLNRWVQLAREVCAEFA